MPSVYAASSLARFNHFQSLYNLQVQTARVHYLKPCEELIPILMFPDVEFFAIIVLESFPEASRHVDLFVAHCQIGKHSLHME